LKLGGINLLALCPLNKIGRAIRWIGTPPLEYVGVDRLVDVDVASHSLRRKRMFVYRMLWNIPLLLQNERSRVQRQSL
jgi:hypothetical protein